MLLKATTICFLLGSQLISFMYHTLDNFSKTSYFHHIYYWIALIVHRHYQKNYIYKNPCSLDSTHCSLFIVEKLVFAHFFYVITMFMFRCKYINNMKDTITSVYTTNIGEKELKMMMFNFVLISYVESCNVKSLLLLYIYIYTILLVIN